MKKHPLHRFLALLLFAFALLASHPLALGEDVALAADTRPAAQVVATPDAATATAVALDPATAVVPPVSAVASPVAMSPEVAVIAAVVPVVIAAIKQVAPGIPPGILPYLAPVLGMLLELMLTRLGYTGGGGWLGGLIAGSAGVGLREKLDQLKKASGFPSLAASVALAPLLAIGLVSAAAFAGSGCAVGRTIISRETSTQSAGTNGIVLTSTVREETRTTAKTLADAKFAQHAFKASQSARTQTIGIGEQSQESTSDSIDKLGGLANSLGRLIAVMQGLPIAAQAAPPPAPVQAPAPRAAAQPAAPAEPPPLKPEIAPALKPETAPAVKPATAPAATPAAK